MKHPNEPRPRGWAAEPLRGSIDSDTYTEEWWKGLSPT